MIGQDSLIGFTHLGPSWLMVNWTHMLMLHSFESPYYHQQINMASWFALRRASERGFSRIHVLLGALDLANNALKRAGQCRLDNQHYRCGPFKICQGLCWVRDLLFWLFWVGYQLPVLAFEVDPSVLVFSVLYVCFEFLLLIYLLLPNK